MIMPQANQPEDKASAKQLASVVTRLQDFLTTYLNEAEHLGINISGEQVLAAIDEARTRCQNKTATPLADQSVEAFFLDGLSAALADEQQGIYEKGVQAEGEEFYRVISDDLWLDCLSELRKTIGDMLD